MAGIGNYIHYHASRYQKYGTTLGREGSSKDFSTVLEKVHRDLEKLYNKKENFAATRWSTYEGFLNYAFYGVKNNSTNEYSKYLTQEQRDEATKVVEQYLINKHGKIINNVEYYITGDGDRNAPVKSKYRYRKGKNTEQITIQSISKLWNSLVIIWNEIQQDIQKGSVSTKTLIEQQQKIEKTMRELDNVINKVEKDKKKVGLKTRAGALQNSDKSLTELGALIQKANQIIKSNSVSEATLSGGAGEAFVAAISMICGRTANEIGDEMLDSIIVGGNTQKTVLSRFDKGFVNIELLAEDWNKTSKKKNKEEKKLWYDDGNSLIYTNETQGTVDLEIHLKTESELAKDMGITDFNASMKNYFSINNIEHPGVKIISGAPLISILMLFNTDFINHYLNLLSAHGSQLYTSKQAEAAKKEVKYAGAIRAITGIRDKNYKGSSSDCLIINVKEKRHVYVLPTSILLEGIYDNIDKYILGNFPERFENPWVGDGRRKFPNSKSAKERVTNLISEVHKFKLYLSLSPKAIKEVASKEK